MKSVSAFALVLFLSSCRAFQPTTPRSTTRGQSTTALFMSDNQRQFLAGALGTVAALVVATAPASATYSAYTHREQDWQQRVNQGAIQYSTSNSLRNQLREIAPMNTEGSKIFCPNGPSAAVSPLMENKCGDRMAMPSVYGRSDDVVGNSIPGFTVGSSRATNSANLSTDVGGFPKY